MNNARKYIAKNQSLCNHQKGSSAVDGSGSGKPEICKQKPCHRIRISQIERKKEIEA